MHELWFPNIELDAQHCMKNHCAHVWNHRFSVSACKNSPQYSHTKSFRITTVRAHTHAYNTVSPTLKDIFWRKHKPMPLNILAYTCARKNINLHFNLCPTSSFQVFCPGHTIPTPQARITLLESSVVSAILRSNVLSISTKRLRVNSCPESTWQKTVCL